MDNLSQLMDTIKDLSAEDALQTILETMVNKGMIEERDIHLKNSSNSNNKANGFYDRKVNWGSKKLSLSVPRDRESEFRSFLLPDNYKRSYMESYDDILHSLIVNGYSKSLLLSTLKCLDLPYSEEEVEKIVESIRSEAVMFREKELDEGYLIVYIDGYVCEIKTEKGIHKNVIYVVIGVDKQGVKDLLGYYAISGSETRDTWKEIFNDLINRGLKKVSMIISDDLTGLDDIIKIYFPNTYHQLCLVHLMRNIHNNLPKTEAKILIDKIQNIRLSKMTLEEAVDDFIQALDSLDTRHNKYMDYLKSKSERYFQFLRYPRAVQKFICTTNTVENFNSVIEKLRVKSGGYFQSIDLIYTNLYLLRRKLKNTKWQRANPMFKEGLYELLQVFNIQFQFTY